MPKHVYIVEDHAVTRMGLVQLVGGEPGLVVCGEAASAAQALDEIPELMPDLVVVDLSLEGSGGLELTQQIAAQWDEVRMLVVSTHEEMLYAERALQAGAHGYVMKREPPEVLLEAIRTVVQGRRYLGEAVTEMLIGRLVGASEPRGAGELAALTDREMEVFELMGRGMRRSAIAETLHLSPKTIDTYRERLKKKLGLSSSTKLVQRATMWFEENR